MTDTALDAEIAQSLREVSETSDALPELPDDYWRPEHLSQDGQDAWKIVTDVLREGRVIRPGPVKKVFQAGEGDYELVVEHDGGDHDPYFNVELHAFEAYSRMASALKCGGFELEALNPTRSVIRRTPLTEEDLRLVCDALGAPTEPPEEPESNVELELNNAVAGLDDVKTSLIDMGFHIKWVKDEPHSPGWGDLGTPKRVVATVLQPRPGESWMINGVAGTELVDYLRRAQSSLGDTLDTTDVDYVSKFVPDLGAWEVVWFIGDPTWTERRGIIGESDDGEGATDFDSLKEIINIPTPRDRMPSGLEGWQDTLQGVYSSFEEFKSYDEIYGLSSRLGFDSAEEAWQANPIIRGSVNPADFGLTAESEADPKEIAAAAKEVETDPSEAQIEAGNYKKGHVTIHGMDISLENPKGSERSGKDKDGKAWKVTLPAHYGYIKGTQGKDKDHIDVFIGEETESEKVYVVNQNKLEGGFDEHKVMLCFPDKATAVEHYDKAYSGDLGPKLRGDVVVTNIAAFKAWLENGNTKVPFKKSDAKVDESILDRLAWRKSIQAKADEARDRMLAEEQDEGMKKMLSEGHGTYKGSCGHRLWGCRCPSRFPCPVVQVDSPCQECSEKVVESDENEIDLPDIEGNWQLATEEPGRWYYRSLVSDVLLIVTEEGQMQYRFSLSIPGSCFSQAAGDFADDRQAIESAMTWAERNPVVMARSREFRSTGE